MARQPARRDLSFAGSERISRQTLVFLLTLVALLIAGTLKLDFLAARLFSVNLAWPGAATVQAVLDRWVPVDAAKGAEGLSLQGLQPHRAAGDDCRRGVARPGPGQQRLQPPDLGGARAG